MCPMEPVVWIKDPARDLSVSQRSRYHAQAAAEWQAKESTFP